MSTDKLKNNFSPTTLDLINNIYQHFAEKSPDVFWVLSPTMCDHIYVSPAYEIVWQRSLESLLGKVDDWIDTIYPEDREALTLAFKMEQLIAEGPSAQYFTEYRIQRPCGEIRYIKDQSFPIFDEHMKCVAIAGIARDVTEDVMRKQEIERAKESAESANRAKADFLASMSHELRTPLNAIIGFSQIINMKNTDADITEYVELIEDSGKHLLTLIDDILDFAKIEEGKLRLEREAFDMASLLDSLLLSFMPRAAKKSLKLNLYYEPSAPKIVISDRKRVRQIFSNLVNNALKFTEQGEISIEVKCLQQDLQKAHFELSVSDTGIGIAKEHLDEIFQRFVRIESPGLVNPGGTGLGLSITKQLLQMMGGDITVESDLGRGSKFICRLGLPTQAALPVPIPVVQSDQTANRFQGARVLLVEDNKINQKITSIFLEELGCEVHIASNAKEALAKLTNGYDLIFMDVGLPEINGVTLTQIIRSREDDVARVPIVAITAHVFAGDRKQCLAAGMNDILVKPVLYEHLQTVLDRWVKQGAV